MTNLRRWISIVEGRIETPTSQPSLLNRDGELPDLPGKVRSLLDKPRQVVLKDGRPISITFTLRDQAGEPAGISVDLQSGDEWVGSMFIAPNNVPPADDDYDLYAEDRGSWSVCDLWVDAAYRRQGLATAMYDMLARAGMKILASGRGYGGKLLPNGAELWHSNQPAVRLGQKPKYQRFWKPKSKNAVPRHAAKTLDTAKTADH